MQKLTIIKVGGKVVEKDDSMKKLLNDFSSIEGLKLLVHGGGKIATDIAARLGLKAEMVNGRRVTNRDMLEVVTMVYGGYVNKNVVAGLQALGCNAIGLTGADLNIIKAIKRPVKDVDFGFVGDILEVNDEAIKVLLNNNFIPVIAPLTHDCNGQILNTNADDITNAVAVALSKHFDITLIFCFDKKGVLMDDNDENSVISTLNKKQFEELVNKKIVYEGMIPKLDNGFKSLNKGVKHVYITNENSIALKIPGGTELIE